MKRNTRTNTVTARALTDPDPKFISLVKGGANQRPFRAVKTDDQNSNDDKSLTTPKVSLAKRWGLSPRDETSDTAEATRAYRRKRFASILGG